MTKMEPKSGGAFGPDGIIEGEHTAIPKGRFASGGVTSLSKFAGLVLGSPFQPYQRAAVDALSDKETISITVTNRRSDKSFEEYERARLERISEIFGASTASACAAVDAAMVKAVRDAFAKRDAFNHLIIADLLGRWVSELEPEITYNSRHEVLGLSFAGQLIIRREGIE